MTSNDYLNVYEKEKKTISIIQYTLDIAMKIFRSLS